MGGGLILIGALKSKWYLPTLFKSSKMSYEPTALTAFFLLCFMIMSAFCFLAGLSGFAINKTQFDKFLSLGLGILFSIGFARLSFETAQRIWS